MDSSFQLKKNKIDVWLCDGSKLKHKIDYFFSVLSTEEQQRAKRFKFEKHQQRFIISHGFKRSILASYLAISPIQILFFTGEKGKPFVNTKIEDLSDFNNQEIQFNLSHTEEITLLAVTKKYQVGIDIESIARKADWQAISQRFFTPSEQSSLFSLNKSQQKLAFYQLWTRKEAYMKVLGSGLSLAATDFSLTVPPQAPELIKHYSHNYRPTAAIFFKQIELAGRFKSFYATLATTSIINDYSIYNYQ